MKKEDAVRAETDAMIEKVYGGSPMLMVTSAVNNGRLKDEEIEALINLLKKEEIYDDEKILDFLYVDFVCPLLQRQFC